MSNQEGFWYSVGRGFYKFFEALEWLQENLSPNMWLIVVGFFAVSSWIFVQWKYNKKAAAEGGLK